MMSSTIQKMSTPKLISLAKDLHYAVYVAECFSTREVMMLDIAEGILEKRGYVRKEFVEYVKE